MQPSSQGVSGSVKTGALWPAEARLVEHRVVQMLAEYLRIILRAEDLVADVHAAHRQLGRFDEGFGCSWQAVPRGPTSNKAW